jgi:hypothetical protein
MARRLSEELTRKEMIDTSTGSVRCPYELPLDMFGADTVERWFGKKEVSEIVEFTNSWLF